MIRLENIKNLGLSITWRLLYKGICENQLSVEDVVAYAMKKLEEGDIRSEVCELAGSYINEQEDICSLLMQLMEQENTQDDFENRKIRAAIVSNALRTKDNNCINGLMNLTDLWIGLGYPSDSPHIIQGRDNHMTPREYYTVENYNLIFDKNVEWLKKELEYLRKMQ